MNLEGKLTVLRAIEENDRDMLLELINDGETERLIGGFSFPVSKLEQEQWIKNQIVNKTALRYVIAEKDKLDIGLGTIILSDIDYKNGVAQVHIKMSKNGGRGKGYGSDALKTLTCYIFNELRLNCLYAEVLDYNAVSQKLFAKCGFKKEAVLRSRIYKNGKYNDVTVWSILKEDFECGGK